MDHPFHVSFLTSPSNSTSPRSNVLSTPSKATSTPSLSASTTNAQSVKSSSQWNTPNAPTTATTPSSTILSALRTAAVQTFKDIETVMEQGYSTTAIPKVGMGITDVEDRNNDLRVSTGFEGDSLLYRLASRALKAGVLLRYNNANNNNANNNSNLSSSPQYSQYINASAYHAVLYPGTRLYFFSQNNDDEAVDCIDLDRNDSVIVRRPDGDDIESSRFEICNASDTGKSVIFEAGKCDICTMLFIYTYM